MTRLIGSRLASGVRPDAISSATISRAAGSAMFHWLPTYWERHHCISVPAEYGARLSCRRSSRIRWARGR